MSGCCNTTSVIAEEGRGDRRLQTLGHPSFFEHLRGAAGAVTLNPAATRLVPPPEVSSQPAGHALTSREVRYLLAGPDGEKSEGDEGLRAAASDAAALAARLRVCSLRASSMRYDHGQENFDQNAVNFLAYEDEE